MGHLHTRVVGVAVTATALAITAMGAPAAQAAPAKPDAPIVKNWANPGVAFTPEEGFVMLRTVRWSAKPAVRTATKVEGRWRDSGTRLLRKAPRWANPEKAVWAPSLIKGGNGRWVVYYSALVRGSKDTRCIGTGTADTRTGPFAPDPQPIACWKGAKTGAQDSIGSKRRIGLIDATPAVVNGQTVLTFKTERKYKNKKGRTMWATSIRMLNLDPHSPNRVIANPVSGRAKSVELTRRKSKYIEENPVLVQRGDTFTLFTSWGWYGTPNYWTQYRQSKNPWTWGKTATRLKFPRSSTTWGRGNAQVIRDSVTGKWWIFWNGHRAKYERGEGPKHLYIGEVGWKQGKPHVKRVLKRK